MKYAEFNMDSYKIEYLNSLFGNEKVLVNGVEVSNRFSVFGTKHKFELNSDSFILSSSFKVLGKRELKLKLEKNQNLVENLNIHLNPEQKVSWGAIAIILGIILFKFLEPFL